MLILASASASQTFDSVPGNDNAVDAMLALLGGDDFDGDGWSNLEEWKAGTDQASADSQPSTPAEAGRPVQMPWLELLLGP